DKRLEVEVLLEQATALDWSDDYAGAAEVAERVIARQREAGIAELRPEITLARARVVYRQARFGAAIALFDEVVPLARAEDRPETETIALLMLGVALAEDKQFDRAELVFRELIALCEQLDDRFHLGVAYANRIILWTTLGQVERAEVDLGTAMQLARETAHGAAGGLATPHPGGAGPWLGAPGGGGGPGRRGLALQRGHGGGAILFGQLPVARVLAARGELGEAGGLLDEIAPH